MARFSRSMITTASLAEELASSRAANLRVLDCSVILDTSSDLKPYKVVSGCEGFAKAHIPTASFFDLNEFSVDPSQQTATDAYGNPLRLMMLEGKDFLQRIGERHGVSNDSHVVLYSQGKVMWATRVWWMLYSSGFGGTYSVLDGGLPKWISEKRETMEGPSASVEPARLAPVAELIPPYQAFVGKQEVAALVAKGKQAASPLVHALPKPHFDGGNDMYGKKGHIKTAINLPFTQLLEEDGTMVDADKARSCFAAAGIPEQPESLTVYCGGGISATLPLFLAVTQMEMACPLHMYDGSLTEWCADEAMPMSPVSQPSVP
eukprot:Rhum_TRINITY_DN13268_c0_g1::Rhum_TRINITY_DN13268_c0_g1_i1::g.58568::m.58568/K01011/TST, MPST, sseA; thiosulfate/3-mercaptopyruvate sulfurtransferase